MTGSDLGSSTLERIQRLERAEHHRLELEEERRRRREGVLAERRPEPSSRRDRVERLERLARYPMTVLGVAWLVLVVVVLTTNLHGTAPDVLVGALFVVWLVVLVEYVARLFLVDDRRAYVSSRAIEPALVAVPALQHLRLLGLERVNLVTVEGALHLKAILVHRGLHRVLLATLGVLFVGSWLVLLFEDHAPNSNIHNYGSALWWGIVTLTTVGYGDKYPVTVGGRCVAVVIMLVGIGLIGVLTATVASFFVQEHTDANKRQLQAAHQDLGDQLTVITDRLARLEQTLATTAGVTIGTPTASAPPDEAATGPAPDDGEEHP